MSQNCTKVGAAQLSFIIQPIRLLFPGVIVANVNYVILLGY